MFTRLRIPALGLLLLSGCAGPVDETELDSIVSALGPCGETVPENRYIDGVPAYAQCPSTEMSAIYSNNGVDTSTTKMGDDWVRTQWSGGYQCTELANRYLRFVWNVKWIPNGNAGQWCDTQPPANSGLVQTTTPVHGDLIVFAPGSCGAAQGTGHVAVVDTVDMASGRVSAVEQNRARRGMYMISCGKCFLHVVANDGSKKPALPASDGGAQLPPVGDPRPDAGALPGAPPARDAAIDRPRGPSTDAGARADAGTPARDAARPPAEDDEDDEEDAGSRDRGEEDDDSADSDDDSSEQDDDEAQDDEASADADDEAKSEGCSVGASASAQQGMWFGLLALALNGRRRRIG